jgi:glycerate kinase
VLLVSGHDLKGCPIVIPRTALVVAGPFGDALSAEDVARAIARGLVAGGQPAPDLCPVEEALPIDFDLRMKRARAVMLAEWRLQEDTLRGSIAFEIATRARQGGVPAYAVTGENALAPFDARILDLQVIFEAKHKRGLASAGRKLARLL